MSQREALVKRFSRGWGSGGKETRCGAGSTLASTAHIRPLLRPLLDRYGVRTLADAGAGDLNWIRHVDLTGLTYRAYDLVPRHADVHAWDITAEALPACDLILCRAVLNHLEPERVQRAIELFKGSARYLLATQFPGVAKAWNDFTPYDLREYGLGEPLEALRDFPGELALWTL
jgi:hypothetical protein